MQIAEADTGLAQASQASRDPGAFRLSIVSVAQLATLVGERQETVGEAGWNGIQPVHELQGQLLLAQLSHQLRLLFNDYQLAIADDTDAVGHHLCLLYVVGRQDDGDSGVTQRPYYVPHALAQLDV